MTWDGTSRTRPDPSVYRAPDGADWSSIVDAVQRNGVREFELTANDSVFIGNIVDSEIKLADSSNNNVLGIAITDGTPGTLIKIKILGVVTRSDWTPVTGVPVLLPGMDYFLTVDGKISVISPTTGWSHQIGYALTATEFVFMKRTSVRL